ncbi:MAG: helix-turn-helix transcriptional regulator [Planctomycetaceae bacterium]|nr:helix-turn-helix transcriptional regulator [Planctomycetaceae bacterium]
MSTSVTSLLDANIQTYIQVRNALEECDPEIQDAIFEMIEICSSDDATEDEKRRARHTILDAIFPGMATDLSEMETRLSKSADARARERAMDQQESTFAENVRSLMQAKDMSQDELARLTGVGQSAIANILGRQSRPQQRTVKKFAEALGVQPSDLWPE